MLEECVKPVGIIDPFNTTRAKTKIQVPSATSHKPCFTPSNLYSSKQLERSHPTFMFHEKFGEHAEFEQQVMKS